MQMIGPVQFEAKVYVMEKDGNREGAVTVSFSAGQLPQLEALHRFIGEALETVGDDFRLMTPHEFWNGVLIKEKIGHTGNFAVPHDFEYDADALAVIAAEARATHNAKKKAKPRKVSRNEEE